ncbi:MotA/TolQ/ExbB proton channel family protein [Rosistilla ulvae]|nr:MotA/TolQ/ExbB proton channel family protein [Rosistilla ulvae]
MPNHHTLVWPAAASAGSATKRLAKPMLASHAAPNQAPRCATTAAAQPTAARSFAALAMMLAFAFSVPGTAAAQQFRQPGQSFQQQGFGQQGGFAPQPTAIPSIPPAAQPQPTAEAPAEEAGEESSSWVPGWASSLKAQISAGGLLMIPLGICSLIVIGLICERLISLRRGRVIPRPFVRRFREKLDDGQLDIEEANEVCNEFDCAVADVFIAAVKRTGRPMVEIEAAVFDALERTADGLRRYLRVFHAVSNVAPLIGLLGTVLGMIDAFETMASEAGAGHPELLAVGISQALVTTAGGLSVAIPAYLAYMYFSSRADGYLAEIERLSLGVIDAVSAESGGAASKTRRRKAA